MAYLGIWLCAVGVADMVADLGGNPRNRSRVIAGVIAAGAIAAFLSIALGGDVGAVVATIMWTLATAGAWLWARSAVAWSSLRVVGALALVVLAPSAWLVAAAALPTLDGGRAPEALEAVELDALLDAGWETVILGLGVVLVLQATGNGVTRLLLALAGTPSGEETGLRGGRLIGPLERTLIFGFVIAGSPGGAAIVAAAKGLLRFPELSKEGERIHAATEYLLVGSLSSWLYAFALSAIVVASRSG